MIRNTFTATCAGCREEKPRCATCVVTGTNAWGDAEVRVVPMCGPCRRECRGRCRLHPKHQPKPKKENA